MDGELESIVDDVPLDVELRSVRGARGREALGQVPVPALVDLRCRG